MKTSFLKFICLVLVICLAFSLFAGCSKKSKNETTSKPVASDVESSEDSAENTEEDNSENTDDIFDEDYYDEEYSDEDYYEEDYYEDDYYEDDYYEEDYYDDEPEIVNLKVYNSRTPINDNYMGMNATVYHCFNYFLRDGSDSRGVYTDEMLDIELDRLENMGFKNMRTQFHSSWLWNSAKGEFDFNTKQVNNFIDYCKALQKRGMNVMLNNMWYFTAPGNNGSNSKTSVDYYLDGNGEDRFGETLNYSDCIATKYMIKSDVSPKDYGLQTTPYKGDLTMTDYYNRIGLSALRYGEITAKFFEVMKANGIYNIDYLFYFTEPSYYYMTLDDPTGPVNEEYLFFCRTLRNVLDKKECMKGVKHVGPNQGHITTGEGLLKYVIEREPELFDVITSHYYPRSGDATNDVYYDYNYEALSSYRQVMQAEGLWGKAEFWQDEMFARMENVTQKTYEISAIANQTIISAICSQQMGVDNILMWQAFDQAFPQSLENSTEFRNGIHITGTCPSFFESSTPYISYYGVGLFTRYNNSPNGGNAIATSSGDYEVGDYPGVYIGATELEDGNFTITVVSINIDDTKFVIDFDKALGKNLHRHREALDKRVPKTSAKLADADATFMNVGNKLTDVIEPFGIYIYTTCEY